jgi:hypothetical protein
MAAAIYRQQKVLSHFLLDWLVINDQKLPNWVWPTLYIQIANTMGFQGKKNLVSQRITNSFYILDSLRAAAMGVLVEIPDDRILWVSSARTRSRSQSFVNCWISEQKNFHSRPSTESLFSRFVTLWFLHAPKSQMQSRAHYKSYNGERAWKDTGERLHAPYYRSRVDHCWKIRSRKIEQMLGNSPL